MDFDMGGAVTEQYIAGDIFQFGVWRSDPEQ